MEAVEESGFAVDEEMVMRREDTHFARMMMWTVALGVPLWVLIVFVVRLLCDSLT